MKKAMFTTLLLLAAVFSFAQNDNYVKAMEEKVAAFDTTRSLQGLTDLANAFERIAAAEKTQWLPYYYAALAHVNAGYTLTNRSINGGLADKLDPIADKAETLLSAAEALSKDNSEIYIVKKMIASLRMLGDPMSRYMQYGPIASGALERAQKLNPENPRVYLLMGQDKLFTPEQFGGNKEEAKKFFATAVQKFDAFKPESTIHPSWGKRTTVYFMSQVK